MMPSAWIAIISQLRSSHGHEMYRNIPMTCRLLHVSILSLLLASPVYAAMSYTPYHLDRKKLPYGCGSCHVGFNFRSGGGQQGCLICHGDPAKRTPGLYRSSKELRDIELELKKDYRHPVKETGVRHNSKEVLPEVNPNVPRHADCVDCHNPHQTGPDRSYAGINPTKSGSSVKSVTKQYELCYLCHSTSANMPVRAINKRAQFAVTNPSFHPVEGEGRNQAVVSLLKPYKEKRIFQSDISIIECTDCHASDDPSSPRGPHGSRYSHILRANYSERDLEPESQFAYAICYGCHERNSILGDESFKFHSLHIKGKSGSNSPTSGGTSCYTCHTSHGSTENKYLIRFNTEVVSPNSVGILRFKEKGAGAFRGECYLSCHGVDHNPKSY